MKIEDAEMRIARADVRHEFSPQVWGEKVNRTLKDMMKEGVETYDWVTQKALELYKRVENGNENENTLRKLLDTLAKTTSLKITACTEMMKIAADIGKDSRTMDEKIRMIADVVQTPFARIVLERAAEMEKKNKEEDDDR